MTILRVGSTSKYSENWENAFGSKKKKAATAKKATKKKVAKKKVAKKKKKS